VKSSERSYLQLGSIERIVFWLLLFVAGSIAWALTADGRSGWTAFLVNFLFFLSMGAGMFTWRVILFITRARWAEGEEYLTSAAWWFCVPSIAALVLLWTGASHWVPWINDTHKLGSWLNINYVFLRDIGALVLFWFLGWLFLRLLKRGGAGLIAGFTAFVYMLTFSLIAVDLAMGLAAPWRSALYPPYFFATGLYSGIVLWTLFSLGSVKVSVLHDMGVLILTLALISVYFMYCQLLTIWFENIPSETKYIVPRLNYPWRWISLALLIMIYLGPIIWLLGSKWKENRFYMGFICCFLLIGLWIERWWLITPTFSEKAIEYTFSYGAATVLFAGLYGVTYEMSVRYGDFREIKSEPV
jgi:hypothetical protein